MNEVDKCTNCIHCNGGNIISCIIKDYLEYLDCPCIDCILKGNCTSICEKRNDTYIRFSSGSFKKG